ncbi:iron-containing alcohol dehydrogenase [Pseudoxanthomonas winnipegensis]|uniref:Iron-containing alcohol dehydrogenase n=1 Tax=Pseudoxanthomonas winnipegensis TaxID=2480810 RepID=A0A4Q8LKE2_9GAMM|nr:iron-containing alcohol dehydrogenase [Pseudoxanthomonas winnipegensis]RZZ85131.1 iron-containing alcohol dehydrogenase [Pseudoxanthomonas winnipegensis]TAA30954.1 iron-containing alcohol dehydrogenase [Pseudoxanthomonas winnipegensis]TAA38691.1 iron-containing alcohol dehydrogenase [Pseudoxanthomonas winnipegensis]TBV77723.1 iron-containing alcohol dehydrogenase [Pseudoxanthomonas winnipegensis]
MSAQVILPRVMHVGAGASQKAGEVLAQLGCSSPLIVTDRMMVELGYVQGVQAALAAAGIVSEVFDQTVPEPTDASIVAGVERVRRGSYDAIIALGGGSPIDSAKAIAILGKHGGVIRDYRFPRQVDAPGLPIIAIPTTAGTGSECTRFTIITDEANDEKLLCVGLGFMPIAALVDYSLTVSVPARTTADTGIDAMTHAMEAYVSRKASAYSDSQAIAAMRLIGPNLRTVFHDGGHRPAREAMMLGSTLAGIAFSNASVALVHGMSRPIGAFFHVPHGLSNAMLLPSVTAWSIPSAPARYADCARFLGAAGPHDSDAVANARLIDFLYAINAELRVPTLEEFGAQGARFFELLPTMAEQALASGSPGNNPRVPSAEEIVGLYKTLWAQPRHEARRA